MEDKYADGLLKNLKYISQLEQGLKYYIDRTHELENEVQILRNAYENRVNEYLKKLGDKNE